MSAQDEPMGERVDLAQFDGHEPGPWLAGDCRRSRDGDAYAPVQTQRYSFDVMAPPSVTLEQHTVNARLIAAAPALLSEVRRLREKRVQLRDAAAEAVGADKDWPSHGNLELAVMSAWALERMAKQQAEAESSRLREENERLSQCSACALAWTPVGIMDSAPCKTCGRVIDLRVFKEMQEQNAGLLRGNAALAADVNRKADERDALRCRLEVAERALVAVKEDRAYQKLSGAPHFTSAPTEHDWKRDSAQRAWALVDAALATLRGKDAKPAEPERRPEAKHVFQPGPLGACGYYLGGDPREPWSRCYRDKDEPIHSSAAPPAEPAAQEGLCTRDCGLPHRHLATACAPLAPPPAASRTCVHCKQQSNEVRGDRCPIGPFRLHTWAPEGPARSEQ